MSATCIGSRCNARAVQKHHVVTRQACRHRWQEEVRHWYEDPSLIDVPWRSLKDVLADERNLVGCCVRCHERHHSRVAPLPLWVLPDAVFEFARALFGPLPAHTYLARYYRDGDLRLDELLDVAA